MICSSLISSTPRRERYAQSLHHKHIHLTPSSLAPCSHTHPFLPPSVQVAKRREKLRFLTRESLQMRNLLSKYAEAVLADIVKRMKEREARAKAKEEEESDDDDDDDDED